MTLTVTQAYDLPSRDEITALGFVIKLTEADPQTRAKLVSQYVLTPRVREELPKIFQTLHRVVNQTGEVGRFVHGSFGSGKSHFLAFLGMLLEDDAVAWAKPDAAIAELAAEHRSWVREAGLLVVRLHMLTAARTGVGFDRTVYGAFNQALRQRGKAEFVFVDVDGILDEARKEARDYGEVFWARMRSEGVAEDAGHFESMATGKAERREGLARKFLAFKGRDPDDAGIDPNWAQGLRRMAEHAREQGFGGVVLLVDELLLWLGEKQRAEFVEAINQLNTIVDHTTGKRAAPFLVFVARQRNIKEFFPDMVEEDELYRHIDHHSKRFELTTLQDVELRHICKERVLVPRPEHAAEVRRVVDNLATTHGRLVESLVRDAEDGVGYLRDVYPFHPALIETLIDISSLMQRERSALRLLYELLVVHYPDLPLGRFLPVGSAFEAIFPESGVEGSKRVSELKAAQKLWYERFRPAIGAMARPEADGGVGLSEARVRTLEQGVRTALLAELSPRLKAGGLTVKRLVQLNDADVGGFTEAGKLLNTYQDLAELARRVTALQVAGERGDAVVGVVLQGANFQELLDRARARYSDPRTWFKPFFELFLEMTKLDKVKAFETSKEGPLDVRWRGTRRRGSIVMANVRDLPNSAFRPKEGEELRILVDYPWDDPGRSVEEDVKKAQDVRKREGTMASLCWLPRHFTPSESALLVDVAATGYLTSPAALDDLLMNLGPADQRQVVEQATSLGATTKVRLRQVTQDVYSISSKDGEGGAKSHGRVEVLLGERIEHAPDADLARHVEWFGVALLDRTKPSHPRFGSEPKADAVDAVVDWMVRAQEAQNHTLEFSGEELDGLRAIGEPLELVQLGQTRGQLRVDGRFMAVVLAEADKGQSVMWDAVDAKLLDGFGLQPVVRNLFLLFLLKGRDYRARRAASGEIEEVKGGARVWSGLRLERANLLDTPQWSRARELGPALFATVSIPSGHRSLGEQDRYAERLAAAGSDARSRLQSLHAKLVKLAPDGDERRKDLRDAMERLKPLVGDKADSYDLLTDLLKLWPDDTSDPLRPLVHGVEAMIGAVDRVDQHARANLELGVEHPAAGHDAREHLESLARDLGSSQAVWELNAAHIEAWNARARAIVKRLITKPVPLPPVPDPDPPPSGDISVVKDEPLSLADGDALGTFIGGLKRTLQGLGHTQVRIDVTVRVDDGGEA